jgi:hypothetical protein
MTRAVDKLVRDRAGGRCEYCQLPQSASKLTFAVDRVIARDRTAAAGPAGRPPHQVG